MNYFNPYYMAYPTASVAPKAGIFKSLFGNLNLSTILSGTSKTLNVVNQAIPLVRQAGPMMKNARTMFRVMNEFKKVETPNPNKNTVPATPIPNQEVRKITEQTTKKASGPTFFL
jgi:hypothetical protein